ncbi:hypothetical protein DFR24_1219 [Panacagrimonas perspica]|uniref:Uncharacterized protein n=2 Tax=Panacagrimonas perspica TaxID=381431 RepID=A0A4R7PCR8_9GAMM|nr:hypothetical protein DFR24_1219 [Panacagrimonas perspica]
MIDLLHLETSFGWAQTGTPPASPEDASNSEDPEIRRTARWHQASPPALPLRGPVQLGEMNSRRPRQFGEFECGFDDRVR